MLWDPLGVPVINLELWQFDKLGGGDPSYLGLLLSVDLSPILFFFSEELTVELLFRLGTDLLFWNLSGITPKDYLEDYGLASGSVP